MPNLVVTNACNLACPFCFATEYRAGGEPAASMSVAEFRELVSFGGTESVRFCGGEPTLHPDFLEMVEIALATSGRRVFLMTNGLWPDRVRSYFVGHAGAFADRVTYLFNILSPGAYRDDQRQRLHATLHSVDPRRVTLGVTIYRAALAHAHLFLLAERFGISHLRFSVAAPNVTDPRSWNVKPERDFAAMASVVYHLVSEARARGLHIHSDCGYLPPCVFTESERRVLTTEVEGVPALQFRCQGPVDIGPGGEAWRCYGLYSVLRANTRDYRHGEELAADFERQTEALKSRGLFTACHDCELREPYGCGGGCYGFRVARALRARARACAIPMDDEGLLGARPQTNEENVHITKRAGREVVMLRDEDDTWAELRLSAPEKWVLGACDGIRTVGTLVNELCARSTHSDPRRVVTGAIRRLFERRAIDLANGEP